MRRVAPSLDWNRSGKQTLLERLGLVLESDIGAGLAVRQAHRERIWFF
ncbi:MAG: hypothetical protein IPP36_08900 [Nitrosomonadales bacterium]|nr:hypothetical protein [Nitrosomonadales bacterium]